MGSNCSNASALLVEDEGDEAENEADEEDEERNPPARVSKAFAAAIDGAMKTLLVEDEGDEAEDDIEEEDERGKELCFHPAGWKHC